MTQVDRLLAALTRAGARGITRVDFQAPTCDGGPPILNIPGRIYDLHKTAIETVVIGERDGCNVYALARLVAQTAPASDPGRVVVEPAPSAEPAALFDLPSDRGSSHWRAA